MVCIFCSHETMVINSRHQKRANNIWRRRRCTHCAATFTSHEAADLTQTLRVRKPGDVTEPFYRDKLFVSILKVCDTLPDPYEAAGALCDTALQTITKHVGDGVLDSGEIARSTARILKRFEPLVALRYASLHSESFDTKKLARGAL
jgi:transcriptional repressor NrdR